jgi:adenylate cyclase
MRTLTADELAREAEADRSLVDELVRIGGLKPSPDGSFSSGDILRVETVKAGLAAGITLDTLERTLGERLQTLEYIDRFYLEPSPRSPRTYREFAAGLGEGAADLGTLYAAFGLAEPPEDSHLHSDEEQVIERFLDAWGAFGDRDMLIRSARLHGEAIRRLIEAVVGLYFEKVSGPSSRLGLELDELVRITVEPATKIAQLEPALLVWLEQRHIEHAINTLNFDELERALVERGWAPPRPEQTPAVAFVDLSGFTAATAEHGDEVATRLVAGLQDLAETNARSHHGRVVKLLGDGAMLRFDHAAAAVASALEIVAEAPGTGLPPAHAGIHAGSLIERDGDIYGHTVNLASRIAGRAGPGEVLVSQAVRDLVPGNAIAFDGLEPVTLKGIATPVTLYRARRAADAAGDGPGTAGQIVE